MMYSRRFIARTAILCLCLMGNIVLAQPLAALAAPGSVTVNENQAMGQNPNSSVQLGPDGTPIGAKGQYYPAEKNMFLGRTPLLTPGECAQRYGPNFCACAYLDDGTQYCHYRRPAAGYYGTKETCESIWGAGQCVCIEPGKCRLAEDESESVPLQCLGTIYLFSGEKMECRQAGVMTVGNNCCEEPGEASEECSFENSAKKLGLDDVAATVLSLGTKLASMAGYDMVEIASQQIAQVMVDTWIKDGSMDLIITSLNSLLGEEIASNAVTQVSNQLAQQGTGMVAEQLAQAAVAEVAAMVASVFSFVGWVYFAYQVYNMIKQLQTCSAGEYMLGCKRAKGVCVKTGSRCKVKVFGSCLQRMSVFCCFSTKLARIINEQGRSQIGRGWGKNSNPDCSGFTVEEFSQLDLNKIDFADFTEDLVRELSPNIMKKYEDSMNNISNRAGGSGAVRD